LIKDIVGRAETLTPIALIGPGGIGKTSIVLTVLHRDRIKKRFGDNRRFIRCDQFPASRTHFLTRLSKAIGAGIENPEDLTPMRPFLSSGEMILCLDNAESILDPQGTNAREIYPVVVELSQFRNICLCLTSRISTFPPGCETLDIPSLSMTAARDAFYRIYKSSDGQSNLVDDILAQLDFHPLSVTLLATVAYHNRWKIDRLTEEWGAHRTGVLHTRHNESLAATIELSLASPMFQDLGPDARRLLGVIAFFPQGIDENNLDWLFPTIPNRKNIFDNLSVISLTHRSDNFITMLAPLRDYLCPKEPASCPLLCATKDRYFHRLSPCIEPGSPKFEEAQWIKLEDMNVEHLLDVFTSIDVNSADVWDACAHFLGHLYWHKKRFVVLGPKINSLPDSHPSKPKCLFELSRLLNSIGNRAEYKRLLVYTLRLRRGRGDDFLVAETLRFLSDANGLLGCHKEGIQQAREALGIYERLNDKIEQARSWQWLGRLLYDDEQLDAAEEAASRAIDLLSDKGEQFPVCECHHLLGDVYYSRGKTENAINHLETALGIAANFNWHDQLFWIHRSFALLFFSDGMFDDAHAHVERAKLHGINNPYLLGRAMELQAGFLYEQHRFGEANSEALRAADIFEKLGAAKELEVCKATLRKIEEATKRPAVSH